MIQTRQEAECLEGNSFRCPCESWSPRSVAVDEMHPLLFVSAALAAAPRSHHANEAFFGSAAGYKMSTSRAEHCVT